MTLDINALASSIAATAQDANKAQTGGGGDYTPPATGPVNLRFVGYVEVGKVKRTILGKEKIEDQAWLVFELSGPRHQPRELDDGTKIPFRITLKLNKSLNEKAKYFKLFKRMNYEGKATHFSQLLGQAFVGRVSHYKYTKDGKERVIAELEDKENGITVAPPRREVYDPETGDTSVVEVNVAPAISDLRLFVWDAPEQIIGDLWQCIHIAKTGDGDRDPNVFQNQIKQAVNFVGSPIEAFLKANGQVADTPRAKTAADLGLDDDGGAPFDGGKPAAKGDPLAGLGYDDDIPF